MTEALEKLIFAQNEDCHTFTLKRSINPFIWIPLLMSGFLWFLIIREWNSSGISLAILMNLLFIYGYVISVLDSFVSNRVKVTGDRIEMSFAEFTYLPRWRKFAFNLSDIESVVPVSLDSSNGDHNFVNVVLKSGELYNVTWRIKLSDTEAIAIAETINNSVKRFQHPQLER